MEIEITSLLETDMFPFSHSASEGGDNAGPNTWLSALKGPRPLLTTGEQFQAFRDFAEGFGAWDTEDVAAWSENECQALFLQFIAGEVREDPAVLYGVEFEEADSGYENGAGWYYTTEKSREASEEYDPFASRHEAYKAASEELHGRRIHSAAYASALDQIDWLAYEAASEAGRIAGRMFRTEDGKIFFSLDS